MEVNAIFDKESEEDFTRRFQQTLILHILCLYWIFYEFMSSVFSGRIASLRETQRVSAVESIKNHWYCTFCILNESIKDNFWRNRWLITWFSHKNWLSSLRFKKPAETKRLYARTLPADLFGLAEHEENATWGLSFMLIWKIKSDISVLTSFAQVDAAANRAFAENVNIFFLSGIYRNIRHLQTN